MFLQGSMFNFWLTTPVTLALRIEIDAPARVCHFPLERVTMIGVVLEIPRHV